MPRIGRRRVEQAAGLAVAGGTAGPLLTSSVTSRRERSSTAVSCFGRDPAGGLLVVEVRLLRRDDRGDQVGGRLALRRRLLGERLAALEVGRERRDGDAEERRRRRQHVGGEQRRRRPGRRRARRARAKPRTAEEPPSRARRSRTCRPGRRPPGRSRPARTPSHQPMRGPNAVAMRRQTPSPRERPRRPRRTRRPTVTRISVRRMSTTFQSSGPPIDRPKLSENGLRTSLENPVNAALSA